MIETVLIKDVTNTLNRYSSKYGHIYERVDKGDEFYEGQGTGLGMANNILRKLVEEE